MRLIGRFRLAPKAQRKLKCSYPLPFETTSSSDPHGQPLLIVMEKLSSHVWISIGVPDDEMNGGMSLQGVREIKGFATHTNQNTTWLLGEALPS